MNKVYKIVLSLLILTGSGCEKDFLEKSPLTSLSITNFWQSEQEVDYALTACYSPLTKDWTWGQSLYFPAIWDGLSDNGIANDQMISIQKLNGFTISGTDFIEKLYQQSYMGLANVNYFLANVSKAPISDANRKKVSAEARFLRAFYFFQLARTFGNVPMPLGDPYLEDRLNPLVNTPRAQLLSQIKTDLDEAIAGLPNVAYTDGHVVKGSAQILKMHTLLLESKFTEAAAIGKDLYEGKIFSLSPSYRNLFVKPGQNNNPEIMFSVKWNPPALAFPNVQTDWILGGTCTPSPNLINDYETLNGLLPADDPKFDATKPYENRDPRLKLTVFTPGDYIGKLFNQSAAGKDLYFQGAASQGANRQTGFIIRKQYNDKVFDENPGYSTVSSQDWVIYRYADALLLYAESLNELEGATSRVYEVMNMIRSRVTMPALPTGLSKDAMRVRIRRERRVELAMENSRYFDLRRWGIAEKTLNGLKLQDPKYQATETPCVYKANYEYWAIPLSIINKNKGLQQNPGYN